MIKKIAVFVAALAVLGSAGPAMAQQPEKKIRHIGFLSIFSQSHTGSQRWHEAFRRGLKDFGWVAGKNIAIEYRWMNRRRERLPALAERYLSRRLFRPSMKALIKSSGLPVFNSPFV